MALFAGFKCLLVNATVVLFLNELSSGCFY
jgi:hypothetical protein